MAIVRRTFWSPDRRYLVTAYAEEADITLMDDNGTVWMPIDEVAGDEPAGSVVNEALAGITRAEVAK